MGEDRIFAIPMAQVGDFVFDEKVVEVFPDMIRRSVPGYGSILAMTAELAECYVQEHTQIYDLGCSLGASTLAIQPRVPDNCTIHAIDSSEPMVRRLNESLVGHTAGARVRTRLDDIRQVLIENASFAILNFTLQFIEQQERQAVLHRISQGLVPGGALVLSEKIHFDDLAQQELMTDLHHRYKRANGYSELEIAQKRSALENILQTETTQQHIDRLLSVGFTKVSLWFQCFNFVSILAVK